MTNLNKKIEELENYFSEESFRDLVTKIEVGIEGCLLAKENGNEVEFKRWVSEKEIEALSNYYNQEILYCPGFFGLSHKSKSISFYRKGIPVTFIWSEGGKTILK